MTLRLTLWLRFFHVFGGKAEPPTHSVFKSEFSRPLLGKKVSFADCPASPWRNALSFIQAAPTAGHLAVSIFAFVNNATVGAGVAK